MITKGVTKVYCIQNYSDDYKYNFRKGNYYRVSVNEAKYSDVRIFDSFDNALGFYLTSFFNTYLVSDYFLTEKEQRKLKLEKIQNDNTKI